MSHQVSLPLWDQLRRDELNQRIAFRNPPIPMFMAFEDRYEPTLHLAVHVPDRDRGGMVSIESVRQIPREILLEDDAYPLAEFTLSVATELLLHELDESLHLDGVRVFDPHDHQIRHAAARKSFMHSRERALRRLHGWGFTPVV